MSHIYGHVDTYDEESPKYEGFEMNLAATQASRQQNDTSRSANTPAFAIANIHARRDLLIPLINTSRMVLERPNGGTPGTKIGFHICLTSFDESIGKYRGFAYDVVPYADHEEAEAKFQLIKGSSRKLEEYTFDEILTTAASPLIQEERHKNVLIQTAEYIKSHSFKTLYFDAAGKLLADDALIDNIVAKVHLARRRAP